MADEIETETKMVEDNTAAKVENTKATNDNEAARAKTNETVKKSTETERQHTEVARTNTEQIKKATLGQGEFAAQIKNNMGLIGSMSGALLGASNALKSFRVDDANLNLFSSQLETTIQLATRAASPITALSSVAKSLGVNIDGLNTVKEITSKIYNAGMAFASSADSAVLFQTALYQSAAASGQLGNFMRANGPEFQNTNNYLKVVGSTITSVAAASGLSSAKVTAYYQNLAKIPGSLESVIKSGSTTTQSMTMLQGAIRLVDGTGREMSGVMDDLKVAFENYNLTGEKALNFTAKMSQVSESLGVPLEDVRGYVSRVSSELKLFGDNTNASANVFNKLYDGFKNTGISAKSASELIGEMTGQIGRLGTAQKAFLSSQTGGAGGLQGAFQIDKLLKEGKVDEVFDKARQMLQKQFGKIVSLDEAAGSQQAAAQFQKQIMLLKSGPLGGLVDSDIKAQKVLESFRNNTPVKSLDDNALKGIFDRGLSVQKQRKTVLSSVQNALESMQIQGNISGRELVVDTITAKNSNKEVADGLTAMINRAQQNSVLNNPRFDEENRLQIGGLDSLGMVKDNIRNIVDGASLAGKALKAEGGKVLSDASSLVTTSASYLVNGAMDKIKSQISSLGNRTDTESVAKRKMLEEQQNQLKLSMSQYKPEPSMASTVVASAMADKKQQQEDGNVAGGMIEPQKVEVTVHNKISGMCINCSREMDEQNAAINPATTLGR